MYIGALICSSELGQSAGALVRKGADGVSTNEVTAFF